MKKHSALLLSSGLAVAAASIAGDVHADTWEMPGQLCQPTSPTQASKISYESSLGLRNTASSALLVSCPVIASAAEINDLTKAVVYFENQHKSQTLSCRLNLLSPTGNVVWQSEKTAVGALGLRNLIWDMPPSDPSQGVVTLYCSVPAFQSDGFGDGYSRIRAYWVHAPS